LTSNGLHDTGEEWAQKSAFRQDTISTRDTEIEILLFNDATDSLSDSSDIGDISSEPTSGNYTRQNVTLDTSEWTLSVQSGDLRVQGTPQFDTTNTTETVDAWAAVVDLQSDVVNSEGSQNPHLLASATFASGSRDLNPVDTVNVDVNLTLD